MRKKKQPIQSRAINFDVMGARAVSEKSYWGDDIWYLKSASSFAREPRLNWKFSLPGGENSLLEKHQVLLASFRETVLGMISEDSGYGKVLSPHSTLGMMAGARDLFRWMVKCGYKSFADLDGQALEIFESDLPKILADRFKFFGIVPGVYDRPRRPVNAPLSSSGEEEVDFVDISSEIFELDEDSETSYDLDEEGAERSEDYFSYEQVSLRISFIFYAYWQSDRFDRFNLPTMPAFPYGGEPCGAIVSRIGTAYCKIIPPFPDEVALPLLTSALNWVNERSKDVLDLVDIYFDALEKDLNPSVELRKFKFSTLEGELGPWRAPIDFEVSEYINHDGWFNSSPLQTFRNVVLNLSGACLIIILFFVGMRVSEVCSLKGGLPSKKKNVAICLEDAFTKDSLTRLFFVNGVTSKGRQFPAKEKWLVGSSPVDSDVMPPAVKALCVLEKLFSKWREVSSLNDLVLNFSRPRGMPRDHSNITPSKTDTILRQIRQFIYTQVDLSALPDESIHGESLVIYRESRGLCIKGHHGRKTFSAYILETRSSLLRAVSQHFKHMNVSITESAYFPAVHRLRQESESQRTADSVAFFVDVVRGEKLAGRMAERIETFFKSDDLKKLSDKDLLEAVEEIVTTNELQVFFNDAGNCFIRANPKGSRCRMAGGGASWKGVKPDYMARSASMCAGCECFAAHRAHLPYWTQREERLEEQARSPGYNPREFRVDERDRKQAKAMVILLSKKNDASRKRKELNEL
ncbi:hypothetical protein F3J24_04275 [Comamonas sp. Tr-654]|uniref:hypothetical protein n=1 Tax=Comamonas sp. Tr-654 TaxID=2608341 RepID=UPI0014214310|nr:hypothetical protein [Comamonas sp. Tr-654]NIF82726.1 hypothetical protein [Comamonas sp. Tr-654]